MVVFFEARLIDADKLEEEVGQATKVEEDGKDHAQLDFAAGEEGGQQEDGNGDGNGRRRQAEFGVFDIGDDDEELDGKSEEEEEIKLEESNIDLRMLECG